jgi:hypothetical protein
VFLPEPYVQEPGERARYQKDYNQNKVNAFDLLLIDHAQEMVMAKICLLPQNTKYVMHFEYK